MRSTHPPPRDIHPGTACRPTVIVAGLSVRGLAESARRAGWQVLALDAFGDLDTRRASAGWWPIAADGDEPAAPRIDATRLLAALLAAMAERPRQSPLLGWVAGSGFEAQPDLLDRAAQVLPLLGMGTADIAALRQPRPCFGMLADLGIDHPEVAFEPPPGEGWLVKDMASSGGQAVCRWSPGRCPTQVADGPDHPLTRYWQREAAGRSLGCLLLARQHDFRLIGVHEHLVDPTDEAPFRHAGMVGPTRLSEGQLATLQAALQRLVVAFRLRGLVSVDWLLDGDRWLLLEVNPRPSASLTVHERRLARTAPCSLLAGHVAQFLPNDPHASVGLDATGPITTRADAGTAALTPCGGERIVVAPVPLRIDAPTLERWAASTHTHDIPSAPIDLPAGAPILSVSADGPDVSAVKRALDQRHAAVLRALRPDGTDDATSPTHPTPSSLDALAAEAL
ncbi:MAG: hypothetical protein RL375_3956 [Pseudomonadota bacterium]